MSDESSEERTREFTVKHGEVRKRPRSHARGTRPKRIGSDVAEEKGLDVEKRTEEVLAQAAIDETLRELKKGDGESLVEEGLPTRWGADLSLRVAKSLGYDVVPTRTGEPTQRPTLSGQSLEDAQREAKMERAKTYFGRGPGRYGK